MQNIKKKISFCFITLTLAYLILILRITYIASNYTLYKKAKEQQNFKLNIIKRRADVYDTNLNRITNKEKIFKAVVIPKNIDVNYLFSICCNTTKSELEKLISTKKPFIVKVKTNISENENIKIYEDVNRYPSSLTYPMHIIGYVNKDNEGVSELEYNLNEYFDKNKYVLNAYIPLNGKQKPINSRHIKLKSKGTVDSGLVLTIDNTLQYVLNKIGKNYIKKGAGVILNCKTGEIVAISSFPNFNPYFVKQYLNDADKPLINRAIDNFSVGSVFKIVIAAAALKQNIDKNFKFCCKGFYKIKDIKYNCHKKEKGHGLIDMTEALKNSCNPYFIDIGLKVGKENILSMAENMGFTRDIVLCNNIICKKSILPNMDMSVGELSNLSFGQGKFESSILHIAQMMSAICNEGIGVVPQIIKGYLENNKFIPIFNPIYFDCNCKKEATILKQMLLNPIVDTKANSLFVTTGGKSSTAQTGQYKKNGQELLNTWFCSFAPEKNTKYIVVLLKEDGIWGTKDLGPAIQLINSYICLYKI